MPRVERHIAKRDLIGEGPAQVTTVFATKISTTPIEELSLDTHFILEVHSILQQPRFLNPIPSCWVICSFVNFFGGLSQSTKNLLDLTMRFRTIDNRSVLEKIQEQQRVLADPLYRLGISVSLEKFEKRTESSLPL